MIENSIKHGLEPRLQGGTITLRSRIQGAKMVVEVEDDGVGMAEGRAREVGFVSRGAGIGMRMCASGWRYSTATAHALKFSAAPGGEPA